VFSTGKKTSSGASYRGSSGRSRTGVRGVAGCPSIGISAIRILEYFAAAIALVLVVLLTLVIASFRVFVFGVLCTGQRKQLRSSAR
jgi:hypothetical protein